MKNLVLITLAIVIVSFLCRCNLTEGPEKVAEKFMNHLAKKEFDEAKKYGTEKTGKTLDFIKGMSEKAENISKGKDTDINYADFKADIDGDKASCTFKGKGGKQESLQLLKKDGKWLVDIGKEDSMFNSMENAFDSMGNAMEKVGDVMGKVMENAADSISGAMDELSDSLDAMKIKVEDDKN